MYYLLLFSSYVTALLLPMSFFLAISFVIAIRYRGYMCLVVAFLIDVQFGLYSSYIPVYLLITTGVLVLAEVIRPYLTIETTA
jgi:hypothetical protein